MSFLNRPFPFFLNNDKENLLLLAGVTLFNHLFIIIFEPFGPEMEESRLLKSIIIFATLITMVIILPRIFTRALDSSNWTVGKYTVYNICILLVLGTAIYAMDLIRFGVPADAPSLLIELWRHISHSVLLGIIPLTLLTLLLKNKILVDIIRAKNSATEHLEEMKESLAHSEATTTISSETSEILEFTAEDFMYAQSQSNYSEISWVEEGSLKTKLLRITLKDLEDQLELSQVSRCHRSYLVNLQHVDEVTGNASGYKLYFSLPDLHIPVSRSASKDVLQKINELAEPV